MNREPKSVLQPVDAAARALAQQLLRQARFAALATLELDSGFPQATRVALALVEGGRLVMLLSELSNHTQALLRDTRCSLLCGEPGEGDPLAHPRITLIGRATRLTREANDFKSLREGYLQQHPKAAMYADFGDFAFWLFGAERASLNAGFGRAYQFSDADIAASLA